jgi:histidinol dehydrogenase
MKTIIFPGKEKWESLCQRPAIEKENLTDTVSEIIRSVRSESDKALLRFAEKFDGAAISNLRVTQDEFDEAKKIIPEKIKDAITVARKNIELFHKSQLSAEPAVETMKGVRCWRKSIPIEKVGLYIPGGTAPLFSTVLMLGIPAEIAGCSEIVLCTPPSANGKVNPYILYAADLIGITSVFKTGGAQAVAAMAYGTQTVPKVYKIFGPGNQYVTRAKELVQLDGVAIDMPAGPSEVLVIADKEANPVFVAADLLSQAEHGPDSQVIMCTDNQELIELVTAEITHQIKSLPRKEIALKALENSSFILLNSLQECIEFSNLYAPEHLIINTQNYETLSASVVNAGSVFLGIYSCESAGDYASGTNHTLPTNGYARNYSGVSIDSFMKKITFQEISREGILKLGPSIEIMAEAEMLDAHKNAVIVRLKSLQND